MVFIKPQTTKVSTKNKKSKQIDVEAQIKPNLLQSSDEWKKVWHYESYADFLAFLKG